MTTRTDRVNDVRIRGKVAIVLGAMALITTGFGTITSWATPSNDNIAAAAPLSPVDADQFSADSEVPVVDATTATTEAGEPQPTGGDCVTMGHTVWFTWTAPANGALRVGVYADPKLNPEVAVYSGATAPTTQVGCNNQGDFSAHDDYSGDVNDALVDVTVTSGAKYWVQMGSIGTGADLQYIAVDTTAPANDNIANAQTASPGTINEESSYSSVLTSATVESNEPQPKTSNCGIVARSRWWKLDPSASGPIDVQVGGDDPTQAAIFSGTQPTTTVGCVTQNDDGPFRFTPVAGTTYWIQIGTSHSSGWANANFLVIAHAKPTNETAATAQPVSVGQWMSQGFGSTYDLTLADADSVDPQPSRCTTAVNKAVWYSFVAPRAAQVEVTAPFSVSPGNPTGLDVLALYTGGSAPSSLVGCATYDRNDPVGTTPQTGGTVSFGPTFKAKVTKGATYWVEVGGTDNEASYGAIGGVALNLAPTLSQTSSHGRITLTLHSVNDYAGLKVIFYQRSGMTGKVTPQGEGTINSSGIATRTLQKRVGQTLAIYAKILGSDHIVSPYSNTVTFRSN